MASISIREFIRWVPDEASEPTSTVVVTSPNRNYVDLRVLRPDSARGFWPTQEETLPLDRLDWGIAGTSSSRQIDDGEGGQISRSQWRHWIDSRTTEPENATDEGDNYPQADGNILEKGIMANPATGLETEYEELWRDEDPLPTSKSSRARSIVVQVENGAQVRGSVVRVGHYCQGLFRRTDKISAERWEWKEDGWKRTIRIGDDALPCEKLLNDEAVFNVGDAINSHDMAWKVVESIQH